MFEGLRPGAPVKNLWLSMSVVAVIGLVGLVVMRIVAQPMLATISLSQTQ